MFKQNDRIKYISFLFLPQKINGKSWGIELKIPLFATQIE